MKVFFCLILLSLTNSLYATVSLQKQSGWVGQQACSATIEQRIKEASDEYVDSGVERITFFDLALPASVEEKKSLDCHGILMVTALTKNESELPVIAKINGKNLLMIKCVSEKNSSSKIDKSLGKSRLSCFFAVPLDLIYQKGLITLDWTKNRKDQLVANLPFPENKMNCSPKKSATISSFKEILSREFCIKL